MSEVDLSLLPVRDMVDELKKRNISFVIAWVDHLSFNKQQNQEIIWALDGGGNLPLQLTLHSLLTSYMDNLHEQVCQLKEDPLK